MRRVTGRVFPLTLSQCQVSASAAPGKAVLGLENVVGVGRDAVCVRADLRKHPSPLRTDFAEWQRGKPPGKPSGEKDLCLFFSGKPSKENEKTFPRK